MPTAIRGTVRNWLVGSLVVTILGGAAVAAAAAPGNMLVNGDFARGLEGWKVDVSRSSGRETVQPIEPQLDPTVLRGQPGHSLKLAITKGRLGSVSQTVPLDPKTKKYRLRFWIKTKDVTDEIFTGATVNWNKPKNAPGFGNEWARVLVEAPEWQQLERIANIESTDGKVTISLFINRRSPSTLPEKGTAWFGGVEFLPLVDKSAGPVWQPPAGLRPVEAAAGNGFGYLPSVCLPAESKSLDLKLVRFRPGLAATTNFGLTYDVSNGKRFCAPSFVDVGLFRKGQPITMVLEGTNSSPQGKRVMVTLKTKDFYGKACPESHLKLSLPPGEFHKQVTLPNPKRYGFFAVLAEVRAGGRIIAWAPSSFCVLERSEPDPFFDVSELQGGDHTWLPIYQYLGFGAINFRWGWAGAFGIISRDYKKDFDELRAHPFYAAYLKSSFQVMAIQCLGLPAWWDKVVKGKLARNENPYTEEFFEDLGNFYSAMADAWPSQARILTLGGETSGAGPFATLLEPRLSKLAHDIFKKKRPAVRFALCLGEGKGWRLPYLRKMIPLLMPYADLVGGDIYTSAAGEPEVGEVRQRILEAQDWAKQYHVSQDFFIPESYCGEVKYAEPLDSPESMQRACHTVRHIILSKSVPGVISYAFNRPAAGMSQRTTVDSSLWKYYADSHCEPRPALAAFSAMTRFLGNTTDPLFFHQHDDFYAVVFRKEKGTRAVFWSVANEPARFRLKLPADATLYDAVGEERGEETGEVTLSASDDPSYVVTDADPTAFAAALGSARFLKETGPSSRPRNRR